MTSPIQELPEPQLDEYLIAPDSLSFECSKSPPDTTGLAQTPTPESLAWAEMLQVAGVSHFSGENSTLWAPLKFSEGLQTPKFLADAPATSMSAAVVNNNQAVIFSPCTSVVPAPLENCESPQIYDDQFEPYHNICPPCCPSNRRGSHQHSASTQQQHCTNCAPWPEEIGQLVSMGRQKNLPYSIIAKYVSEMRGVTTLVREVKERYGSPSKHQRKRDGGGIEAVFVTPRFWSNDADNYLLALRDDPDGHSWAEIARKVSDFRGVRIGASTAFNRYWKCKNLKITGYPVKRKAGHSGGLDRFSFKKFVAAHKT